MLKVCVSAAVSCALLLLSMSVGEVRAAGSKTSSTADDFVALLSFVGGTPLTEPERDRVKAEIASQLRSDPSGVYSSEAKVRRF
jgi:hypothetical protein